MIVASSNQYSQKICISNLVNQVCKFSPNFYDITGLSNWRKRREVDISLTNRLELPRAVETGKE